MVRLVELSRQSDSKDGLNQLGALLERASLKKSGAAIGDTSAGKVGLALSGGGFRASLFHIGVLAKLADIGVLNRIEALSCVSGGSIIGAHYYLELRRLYEIEKKTDDQLSRADYVSVVKNLERDFLAGVRKNIRTRVISSIVSNVRMIFSRDYSRTTRVGELYERHIYSRVEDREGHAPRWLDELKILPADECQTSFNPRQENWRRRNKIPILILNATSLNTGHVWQFTASYMGEPPAAINTEIDAGYRLRRMYYGDAPGLYRNEEGARRRVRLGDAVASSSCVPGMFEPLALPSLYPDRTVQLVDGGVFDNQGTASLLEQDCSVLLVSDASGQMTTEDYPTTGILGVVMRASLISQERIRWTQYRELDARRRSGQLKDLMFIHLKKDLDSDPADWIDCPDPYDATSDARPPELRGPLTRYGVRKDLQRLLAAVRTDLDSFSDGEAYALMASGYLMTEHQFAQCRGSFPEVTDADLRQRGSWLFLDYEETLTKPGLGERLKQLLEVASESVFKIWRLSRSLHLTLEALKTGLLGGLIWLIFWYFKNPGRIPTDLFERPLVSVTFGAGKGPFTLKVGWVMITLLSLLLGKVFGERVMKVASWPDTIRRAVTGVVAATLGGLLSGLHLLIFDRLYLRWGRTHRLINLRKKRKDDC
ncbi:MAG: patatin-like phospholipase family protein, partial [Acidobacteriota bacterium]